MIALGANTYATQARIQALVGDLVTSGVFTTLTSPTLVEVEAIADDIAAELNSNLELGGYTVPVAVGNDPQAHAWLVAANSAGAAAMVLSTFPGAALDPDAAEETSPVRNRISMLWGRYRACLSAITRGRFPATRSVSGFVAKAYAGSQEDSDGNTKSPIFTRSLTDYPGTWSLTE